MGDLMADPINMNMQHQLRHATRELMEANKRASLIAARIEAAVAKLEEMAERRGPGRPRKEEAA
jgi:hypothetical protein